VSRPSPCRVTALWRSWARLAVVVAVASGVGGCPPSDVPGEPPLRPLVYTESPGGTTSPTLPGYEMWTGETDPTAYPDETGLLGRRRSDERVAPDQLDLSTPEALGRLVFQALARLDEDLLEHLLMTPEEYARAARTSYSRAVEHVAQARAEMADVLGVFRGQVPSEQRPGGLGGMLRLEAVNARSYRRVTGEIIPAGSSEPGEMVLGSEIVLRLGDTDQLFRLRLPKVLRDATGQWRLAEAPEVGGTLQLFTEMGFQLSGTLLSFEHYPLPWQTGNYWMYQVRTLERQVGEVEARIEGHPEPERRDRSERVVARDPSLPLIRDEVASRQDYDGYSLVWIARTDGQPRSTPRRRAYLVTARRVYRCERDCQRHIDEIDWLLDHLSRRTPELIFPLRPGLGWRTGGRLSAEGEYQTRQREEVAHVPAGRFEGTICVTRSTNEGREHRYVAPGIGVVLTRVEGSTTTTYQELVEYRILP
jgi:hypothetical protein